MLIPQILRHQHLDGLANQFLRCVSEEGLGTPIGEYDPAVRIGDDRGVGGGVQELVNDLGGQFTGGHRGAHEMAKLSIIKAVPG